MSYKIKKPVKLPKYRKYAVFHRTFNDKKSMDAGRKCGAVQAGNWPEEGVSGVGCTFVRAKTMIEAYDKFMTDVTKKYLNWWDDRDEVIAVYECGSQKYEFTVNCDLEKNDKFGNDKKMKIVKIKG